MISKEELRERLEKIEFLQDATNVYRTDKYIVRQDISIVGNYVDGNNVLSNDTYYLRTEQRDSDYDLAFRFVKNRNGKRMPSTMFVRKYID